MQSVHSNETAMRREIRSTLRANAIASSAVVLGNWRYREGGTVTPEEAERLEALYTEEYALRGGEAAPQPARPWWRFW
jgi:hypothetical protein